MDVTLIKPQDLAEDAAFPSVYAVVTLHHKPALEFTKSHNTGGILWVAHLNIPLLQLVLGDK